jgi:hypothetical protein
MSTSRPTVNMPFVVIGVVCIAAAITLGVLSINALRTGDTIHFLESDSGPMTAAEGLLGACIAFGIGVYGIRLGLKGER